MNSNKRGVEFTIGTLVAIALGVAVVIFVLLPLMRSSNTLGGWTVCERQGGECVYDCNQAGDERKPTADASCTEPGQFCCITASSRAARQGSGGVSGTIQLLVTDKTTPYSHLQTVPLILGKKNYEFTLSTQDFKNERCNIYIQDDILDEKVVVEGGRIATTLAQPCDGGKLDGITFTHSNLLQDLELHADVLDPNDASKTLAYFKYNIDLKPPVTIRSLSGRWDRNESFTIDCDIGNCKSVKVGVTPPITQNPNMDSYSDQADFCYKNVVNSNLKAGFQAGSALVEIKDETWPFLGISGGLVDAPLCLEITLDDNPSDPTVLKVVSNNNLKIDRNPPTVTIDSQGVLTCVDGRVGGPSESGCLNTYYYFKQPYYRASDLAYIKNDPTGALKQALVANLLQDRSCSNIGYRTARQLEQSVVLGGVCFYAKDIAGNPTVYDFKVYQNPQQIAIAIGQTSAQGLASIFLSSAFAGLLT